MDNINYVFTFFVCQHHNFFCVLFFLDLPGVNMDVKLLLQLLKIAELEEEARVEDFNGTSANPEVSKVLRTSVGTGESAVSDFNKSILDRNNLTGPSVVPVSIAGDTDWIVWMAVSFIGLFIILIIKVLCHWCSQCGEYRSVCANMMENNTEVKVLFSFFGRTQEENAPSKLFFRVSSPKLPEPPPPPPSGINIPRNGRRFSHQRKEQQYTSVEDLDLKIEEMSGGDLSSQDIYSGNWRNQGIMTIDGISSEW